MAWETRAGGKFFYRSVRKDGRVVKQYYGRGAAARAAELALSEARAARDAEALSLRSQKERCGPADRLTDDLDAACRALTAEALKAAGYRRVHYEWRRS